MKSVIILLSNSYPWGGEPFLKTEMSLLPENLQMRIFPFFPPGKGQREDTGLWKAFPFHGSASFGQKCMAAVHSAVNLLKQHELQETVKYPGWIRNLIKALKFGYISELRVESTAREIRKEGTDRQQILLYAYWMYETAYVGARLKQLFPGSRFVTRCHGYDLYAERHPNGYLPYRKFILESAERIYPVSQKGLNYLKEVYSGRYDRKIQVARLGTVRLMRPVEDYDQPNEICIVSCSNLIPVKRVHLIIQALKTMKEPVKWIHFGDGTLRKELENQAQTLPQNVKAEFRGFVANEEIQRFYATHYITAFVNVSESEGVPVSVMEAESYGIPVIATDVGGTAEIIDNGGNGVLLQKNFSDSELTEAIQCVKRQRAMFSRKAIETWERMSNAKKTTRLFYQYLEEAEQA